MELLFDNNNIKFRLLDHCLVFDFDTWTGIRRIANLSVPAFTVPVAINVGLFFANVKLVQKWKYSFL